MYSFEITQKHGKSQGVGVWKYGYRILKDGVEVYNRPCNTIDYDKTRREAEGAIRNPHFLATLKG